MDRRSEIKHRKTQPNGRPVYVFKYLFHPLSLSDDNKLSWKMYIEGVDLDEILNEENWDEDKYEKLIKTKQYMGKSVFRTDHDIHLEVPAVFDICPTCKGKGTHVNPSIDRHGLTREDFLEDPDFEEEYFNGTYDIKCNECDGLRVVPCLEDADGNFLDKDYEILLEKEMKFIENNYTDRKTRWYEDGCPRDYGPEDY